MWHKVLLNNVAGYPPATTNVNCMHLPEYNWWVTRNDFEQSSILKQLVCAVMAHNSNLTSAPSEIVYLSCMLRRWARVESSRHTVCHWWDLFPVQTLEPHSFLTLQSVPHQLLLWPHLSQISQHVIKAIKIFQLLYSRRLYETAAPACWLFSLYHHIFFIWLVL